MTSALHRVRGLGGLLLLVALVSACGTSGNEELSQWMAEQRNTVKPKVEPVSEPKPYVPQEFTQLAELSPFSDEKLTRSFKDEAATAAATGLLAAEVNRRKEPLEALPLDTMVMVGLLDRRGQKVALVRANNLLYQVRVGNYLGQNYGRILGITEGEIKLREIVQDAAGEWIERMTSLELQEGTGK
ncbi:pilus assembly protein PilP [Macromonas nakdongensis]|uniref:pilus assembly protein PilP n=1 Tax=Macromonas nakdongensis TaxID=1843082 RepID=UPI000C33998B|nr:pilus assembly protein PilP [Macromonas nakdongensis]